MFSGLGLTAEGLSRGLSDGAFVQLLDGEHHVPVLTPYYITMFDGELLEIPGLNVTVVLGVGVRKDERPEIHCLGSAVAEEDMKAHISRIFCAYYIQSNGFHYFTFFVIWVQRTLFFSTKKFIHFSTMFL